VSKTLSPPTVSTGLPQSYADALIWYQKAAEQGFARAQHNLGALYGNGQGTNRDFVTAYKWLLLAHQSGYTDSQQALDWLRPQMKSEQIAEAEHQADQWVIAHARH
jgi:uncharacterized protein